MIFLDFTKVFLIETKTRVKDIGSIILYFQFSTGNYNQPSEW
ncbi:hypothetical protein LEP1GSC029_0597 [Leptospira interrogans str. 2002000626]|uniref:Uncharacterized protein n=1 Tax=Leptospira interrogans str. 2002000626 TaxID=996803 RepID=A0A829CXJ6_LEPIR|nr:hypothetical protein LEP1GSC029_0597 [Leptospira interrogans str. 2002000626]